MLNKIITENKNFRRFFALLLSVPDIEADRFFDRTCPPPESRIVVSTNNMVNWLHYNLSTKTLTHDDRFFEDTQARDNYSLCLESCLMKIYNEMEPDVKIEIAILLSGIKCDARRNTKCCERFGVVEDYRSHNSRQIFVQWYNDIKEVAYACAIAKCCDHQVYKSDQYNCIFVFIRTYQI